MFELVEFFLGPQPAEGRNSRHPDRAVRAAEEAGLTVVDLRHEKLRTEFVAHSTRFLIEARKP